MRPFPPAEAMMIAALFSTTVTAQETERWRSEREAMVERQIVARGVADPLTLAAMRAVPRHEFVPAGKRDDAYVDFPLPIGFGATISQPYIVALMTELARPAPGLRVLEIGTGSGYQAAVLAQTGCRVWTIEIEPALATSARDRLARLGYAGVAVRTGDGRLGWPEASPFDAILVTAAADQVPPALLAQLAPGGRLVIPVDVPAGHQDLMVIEKAADGTTRERRVIPVRFVPLRRGP
jgi:protein-L-isoaspartate(D-aspartate) O-methyltransferase